jgi:citronellol/citronellal dehydrogenase
MPQDLAGRTMFITGGSRGIGLAIALRAARDGANVALLAKTAEPHPKLPGTIYTAAEEIEAAGGTALPIVGDVRDADSVANAVEQAAERFGGIDILVNNASAISLTPIEQTEPKRFDLMQGINVRGTFLAIRACIPHLKGSDNGHILSLSPPINLDPAWLGAHGAYTLSKYGMTLITLSAAEELREAGVAANTLWPRTIIATAAVQNLLGGDEAMSRARSPEIYADSAHEILRQPAREYTGQSLIDDEVLAAAGVTDLEQYRAGEGDGELIGDLFVDPAPLR